MIFKDIKMQFWQTILSTPLILGWKVFLELTDQYSYTTHQVKKVDLDFSWAFLHASVEAFNKTDLKTYLQMSFEVTNKAKEISAVSFFTIIHLCSSHIIKAVCKLLV